MILPASGRPNARYCIDLTSIGRAGGISDQRTAAGALLGLIGLEESELKGAGAGVVSVFVSATEDQIHEYFGPLPAWLDLHSGLHVGRRLVANTITLGRAMARMNPDASLYYHFPPYARRRRPPTVTLVPDIIPIRFPGAFPRKERLYYSLQRPILRHSRSTILTASAAEALMLRRFGYLRGDAAMVRWGLESVPLVPVGGPEPGSESPNTRPRPAEGRDRCVPYGLHVGRLSWRKNIPRLLEGWQRSVLSSGLRLLFVGPCEDVRIRRTIEACESADYLGQVGEAELESLYTGCEFVLVGSRAEGFGLPVGEGIRRGKRVIVSDLKCFTEMTRFAPASVATFDPVSTRSITAALDLLPELRSPSSSEIASLIAHFNWRNSARDILGALARAVDQSL